MSSKRTIIVLVLLMLFFNAALFAEENVVKGDTGASFSLIHRVSVDASLNFKFTNAQGATITNRNLEIGTTNNVGMLYATFNTTRKINLQLTWTPLILEGGAVASTETAYPYTMVLADHSGNALPDYASPEAGVADAATEFVVYGEYGSGQAYFINKWLNKTSTQMFEDSLICSMSISIEENSSLPPGTYSGSIYFITSGS